MTEVKQLFLVDDEPLVLRALERMMRQEKYETRCFAGPAEALAALETSRPDCVISDYYMPKTDGLTFLEKVKGIDPRIGRVLLTGGYIDDRVRAALEGETVNVLIQKPWHLKYLREVMEHVRAGRSGVFIGKHKLKSGSPSSGDGTSVSAGPATAPVDRPAVLVLAGDDVFRQMMESWLSRRGYRVRAFRTAGEAVESAREQTPDVIVLDPATPGQASVRMLDMLRDCFPRTPIIAVTESSQRNLVVETFRQGATCTLQKPVSPDTLESTVHRCLQLRGLLDDRTSRPELNAIMEMHHAIASGMTGAGLLDLLLQEMIRHTGADAASVLLVEPGDGKLRVAASYGLDDRLVRQERILLGERISGWVVEHNQPQVVIGDAGDDPRMKGASRATPAAVGMCLPMRGRDRVTGALCVTRFEGEEAFDRDAVDLGVLLGGEVARALERNQAAEERADLERSMLHRDKLATIGELASGMAHEINNPLGYVSSNLSSLTNCIKDLLPVLQCLSAGKNQPDPEGALAAARKLDLEYILSDLPQCLQETNEGLKHVLKIVDNLKTFAREDSEEKEMANINQILDGAVAIVWNQIKNKAEITREYGDLPALPCYPSQLGQLFLNLVYNAAQAIEKDGHIVLRTALEDGNAVVEVEDDGCGMPPDVQKRIFDTFFTTKPRGVGTGLGLSIAKRIVERHAGTLQATSRVGRGSLFRVTLPRP